MVRKERFIVYKYINQDAICMLEKISIEVRDALQIPVDKIINSLYLEELVLKINENCENLKVIKDYNIYFELSDDNNVIIKYNGNGNINEQFEFIIRSFCYALLLNQSKLNKSQLQNYNVDPQIILDDTESEFLSRMIMMPKNLFINELVNFSNNNSSVDILAMQKKLKINSEDIVERGRYLPVWDRI